jgi:hypothetical protein
VTLQQTTFLGASIVSFNASLGWGTELSTLNTTLVEDPKNLDWFNPPDVGHPIVFNYAGWIFRGLLSNWKYQKSSSGFTYSVTCVDPREILEGYQIILGGYTSTITTPNISNVYGYWENTGFGNSQKNETGMPWKKVRDGVLANANTSTGYGGPVSLRGVQYTLNLSALPPLNDKYRVGGETVSAMDFISDVCEAASRDFFVTLEPGNVITLHTIDRSAAVSIGALTAYINSTSQVTSSEAGVEHRPDVMGKVLLGGQQIKMYGQTKGGTRIWPFWGFEDNYDVKMGTGLNNDHKVKLDSRSVQVPGVGNTYEIDVHELRAAMDSAVAWEDFLIYQDKVGTPANNIHYNKTDELDLIGYTHKKFDTKMAPGMNMALTSDQVQSASNAMKSDHEEAISRLYSFVLEYARDFYGKQFLVSIPDVDAATEPDTDKVRVSLEPVNAGFIDPAEWDLAISNNLIPQDFNRLTGDDGRFPPYARYDNITDLDFSEVSDDAIVYNATQTSAFIKCSVREGVAFEDVANTVLPRAVIQLPGAVRARLTDNSSFGGVVKDRMDSEIANGTATTDEKDDFLFHYGIDNLYTGKLGLSAVPDLVAIPLQDNTKVYGPWEKIGSNGKMSIEQDDSLVPWNYGGFAELNLVGDAKVQDNVSFMHELETGSIEVPGIPTFTMGAQLVSAGPYVTDIDVSIGEQGVTSIYRFSTWTQKFGKLRKSNVERYSILSKKNAANERRVRLQDKKTGAVSNFQREMRKIEKPKRKGGSSSHGVLSGEGIIGSGEDLSYYPNVFVQPHYNFTSQLGRNYEKKAAVSMDGIFRPFTTNVEASSIGMPYFRTPASGADFPTSSDLNPYRSGTDIVMALRGSSLPDDLTLHRDPYFESDWRGMAFRGPLVIAGWGYDSDGKPVPNESGGVGETRTDNFASGYLQNQGLWPVGPVDLPWDADRGVWVGGGGGSKVVQIVRESSLQPFPCSVKSVYYAQEMDLSFDQTVGNSVTVTPKEDSYLFVGNFRNNLILESGIYSTIKVNNKYYIDNQGSFNEVLP